ncbi:MAG: TIR domain-containing protein [Desulfosarcina sp.]|nr:TIR domain-containing protein [Desulfobacterales bacterium]
MANPTENLKLVNDSNYRGNRNWGWNVWLDGPAVEEGQVESVTYFLHPTFSNPIHMVADKSSNFKLSGSGWGEFNIKAEVALTGGETLTLNHWLQFDAAAKQQARQDAKGKVFLSHSMADGPVANRLASLLIAKGYRVTATAMVDVAAGTDWQYELKKNIELADLNVVFISPGTSEYIGTVISRMLASDEGIRGKLLPVLLGSVEISEHVSDVQILRIASMNELEKVVDAVENLFEG